jgi:hypothetical protein
MKLPSFLLFAALSALHAEDPGLIINTRFDQASDGELAFSSGEASDFPLTVPSTITATSPSTVTPGKEPVGEIKPPYALVAVRGTADNPQAPATVGMSWEFKNPALEPGRYQIQFRVAVAEFVEQGGHFMVGFVGKPYTQLIDKVPRISFADGAFRSQKGGPRISPGETFLLEFIVDTQKLNWSASANGEPLAEEVPFDPDFIAEVGGELRIESFNYLCMGGFPNCKPGITFALADVKMSKLDK